jgi:hypothetical protein
MGASSVERGLLRVTPDRPARPLRGQDRCCVNQGRQHCLAFAQPCQFGPDFGKLVSGGKFVHDASCLTLTLMTIRKHFAKENA